MRVVVHFAGHDDRGGHVVQVGNVEISCASASSSVVDECDVILWSLLGNSLGLALLGNSFAFAFALSCARPGHSLGRNQCERAANATAECGSACRGGAGGCRCTSPVDIAAKGRRAAPLSPSMGEGARAGHTPPSVPAVAPLPLLRAHCCGHGACARLRRWRLLHDGQMGGTPGCSLCARWICVWLRP